MLELCVCGQVDLMYNLLNNLLHKVPKLCVCGQIDQMYNLLTKVPKFCVCGQVDLMYNLENNMPVFMQRQVHVKRATVKPNEGTSSFWQNVRMHPIG